jgi:hypothetical protein
MRSIISVRSLNQRRCRSLAWVEFTPLAEPLRYQQMIQDRESQLQEDSHE